MLLTFFEIRTKERQKIKQISPYSPAGIKKFNEINFSFKEKGIFNDGRDIYYWNTNLFIELIKNSDKLKNSVVLATAFFHGKFGETKSVDIIQNVRDYVVIDKILDEFDPLTFKALALESPSNDIEEILDGVELYVDYNLKNSIAIANKFNKVIDTTIKVKVNGKTKSVKL